MSYLNNLASATNMTKTFNGADTHVTTNSALLDMYALGGAYRSRSDEDCINLFLKAYREQPEYALKCLFYLRDVRGGQGERRFFRVVMRYLACKKTEAARRNLELVPEYGRWDDLYCLEGTPLESEMFAFMKKQLVLDMQCETPSLLAKWMKSINTSSKESRRLGEKTRAAIGMTQRQYRKTLSVLRERIKVVEKLMSENRWDEIVFDKLPSKAGLIYKNAFARRDILKEQYRVFAENKDTKVNAGTLYPYDVANKAFACRETDYNGTDRLMIQKYWDNLPDYYEGREENAIAIVDTSGSMSGFPIAAAVSLGAYIADKSKGLFAGHFITFSSKPELIKFEGVDITDKFRRAIRASWMMDTNLEAVFDLLLNTALKNKTPVTELPARLYILSDMEFNQGLTCGPVKNTRSWEYSSSSKRMTSTNEVNTLMENIAKEWAQYGYKLPKVIFWNLNAMQDNIPAIGDGFSYVSGCSPVALKTILSGGDAYTLMYRTLNSERYAQIH